MVKEPNPTNRNARRNLLKFSDTLDDLEQRLRTVEGTLGMGTGYIEKILNARGLECIPAAPNDRFLQPSPPTTVHLERFYSQLHRYSFRLFLRDILAHRPDFSMEDCTRYCSPRTATKYLNRLLDLGVIRSDNGQSFRMVNKNVHTFGETLEWYVAQVFRREFASPAVWGVKVRHLPPGGDFDVIAEVDRRLVYVEVKSSPPKGIHLPNVREFLTRMDILSPDVALFLVDTHLRMENKINVLFRQAVGLPGSKTKPIRMVSRGVFQAAENILILNAKPSLIHNIRVSLIHYFRNRE